jgi:hypothetical protein
MRQKKMRLQQTLPDLDLIQNSVHDFFDGARQIQKDKANLSKPYISLLINSRYKRHDN